MNPTFRQLTIFESVARNLSYTKASKELHLSQPAVSMQIKLLEEQTELPLFERVGRKMFLTSPGMEVYLYAKQSIQQKTDIEETIEQLKDRQTGHLNIGVASTANRLVIRLLAEFEKKYPKITITLDVTNRGELLKQLENNERDFVIMGQPPEGTQVNSINFLDNPLVVIASMDHSLGRNNKIIDLVSLSHQRFIVREVGSGTRKASEKLFLEHGLSFNTSMDMTNDSAIKHAVEAGLGLAIVSIHTLAIELKAQSVRILNVEKFPIMQQWFMVENKDKRLSPIAQEFKQFVLKNARKVVDSKGYYP